jgi:hypothetical protein
MNYTKPGDFTVSPTILYTNPGAFSATYAGEPINSLFNAGGYEPIMLGRRYVALDDTATDTVVLSKV